MGIENLIECFELAYKTARDNTVRSKENFLWEDIKIIRDGEEISTTDLQSPDKEEYKKKILENFRKKKFEGSFISKAISLVMWNGIYKQEPLLYTIECELIKTFEKKDYFNLNELNKYKYFNFNINDLLYLHSELNVRPAESDHLRESIISNIYNRGYFKIYYPSDHFNKLKKLKKCNEAINETTEKLKDIYNNVIIPNIKEFREWLLKEHPSKKFIKQINANSHEDHIERITRHNGYKASINRG